MDSQHQQVRALLAGAGRLGRRHCQAHGRPPACTRAVHGAAVRVDVRVAARAGGPGQAGVLAAGRDLVARGPCLDQERPLGRLGLTIGLDVPFDGYAAGGKASRYTVLFYWYTRSH